MNSVIIPAQYQHIPKMMELLTKQEEWHILAIDALLNNPFKEREWYLDIDQRNNKLYGVLLKDKQLIHLGYNQVHHSLAALYSWLSKQGTIITHGNEKIIAPILGSLARSPAHHVQRLERAYYLQQTSMTEQIVKQFKLQRSKDINIRQAQVKDLPAIKRLYQASTVEHLIDPRLIRQLVSQKRILIAEYKHRLVGTIMTLKESKSFALIGGLYVAGEYRNRGIATVLAYTLLEQLIRANKRVCFYFHDQELKHFYSKGGFKHLGLWCSYMLTSKRII